MGNAVHFDQLGIRVCKFNRIEIFSLDILYKRQFSEFGTIYIDICNDQPLILLILASLCARRRRSPAIRRYPSSFSNTTIGCSKP